MDHSQAPILEALAEYHRAGQTPFTPPGHKQARGADPRVRAVLGDAVFRSDVLAVSGLDDRTSKGRVLQRAQELMADAVHAERTFFSTCGSSLSVKSAMLAVAGPHEKLLAGRDAHKSVVSGLILSGVRPVWSSPTGIRLPQADLPRDAFFGPTEAVPLLKAAGRVAAEMLTPYPPGIPVALPGEELNAAVLEYLRTGVDAGMSVPDARDPSLDTVRVVAES
jgi:arginine/lysine/ornithine decarboxylase